MIEYWLQKKSLGGWSVVTWYSADELAKAQASFKACVGMERLSGYSWRLVEVKVVEQALLDEVTDVEPPGLAPELPQKPVLAVTPAGVKGWSKTGGSWGDHSGAAVPVKSNGGWGVKLNPEQQADVNNAWNNFKTCNTVSAGKEHGLIGSVWLIHHEQKTKVRVKADEVDRYLSQGYERGGPKTKFRE